MNAVRRAAVGGAFLAPATLLVLTFVSIPLLFLIRISFNRFVPGVGIVKAWTLENYAAFLADPFYQKVLLTTLWISLLCTALSVLLAFPVAYLLARLRHGAKDALMAVVIFPLFVGNVVRAAGWEAFLGPSGFLNGTLRSWHLIDKPLLILQTPLAVVIGITAVLTPYMILTLQSVLERIDWSLEEAAMNLGASAVRTFLRITLPLAMPGLIAGGSLMFILSMNAYATPLLLGGPAFRMMAQSVYDNIATTQDWPFGAVLAFVLMAATLAVTALAQAVLRRRYATLP